jgi:outer membrane protein assembly factor BamB
MFLIALITLFLQSPLDNKSLSEVNLAKPLKIQWQYRSDEMMNLTAAGFGERVYLPLEKGSLLALDTSRGELMWRAEIGGILSAAPMADESGVYVASETVGSAARGTIRALGRESGVTLWMRTLPHPLKGMTIDGQSLYAGAVDGRLYCFNIKTGDIQWSVELGSALDSKPVIFKNLYVGSKSGSLFCLNMKGQILWRYKTKGAIRTAPDSSNGLVFAGSADGHIYCLTENGKLLWKKRTGAGVQAVKAVENGILVTSLDNFVYLLSKRYGEILWKRQLAGRIQALPLTSGSRVLLSPLSSDSSVVLDLSDGNQVNTLATGDDSSTSASPLMISGRVLISTRSGLLAFTN